MKCLIIATCLLAVASAGIVGHSSYGYAPLAYQAAYIPVLDHNGYQLDTPEVAHAKAAHFAAHADAHARNGHVGVVASHAIAPIAPAIAPLAYAGHYGQHYPVIDHNGFQVDTPEVSHARAAHFAAYAQEAARNAHGAHYRKRRGLIAPLAYAHAYPQHIPVIGPNGVPLETPEVVAAKAHHAAAHVEAHARNGHYDAPLIHYAPLAYASHGVAAPVSYAHGHYHGPQHIPVIGPHGVPLDTPEVAAGKIANAVAHAEAYARNGDHLGYVAPYAAHSASYAAPLSVAHHLPLVAHNGVPIDTPEVAVAKAHHAAAHVEALARSHHY